MIATDFIYDGQRLSELGFMICQFDEGGGFISSSAGSQLTFYKVSANCGRNYWMAGAKYDMPFETSFSICKANGTTFAVSELSYLMRWLNRTDFHDFYIGMVPSIRTDWFVVDRDEDYIATKTEKLLNLIEFTDYAYDDIHYRGTFNIDKVEHRGRIIGLNLNFTSDSPFGYGTPVTHSFNLAANGTETITDLSDEVGYLYPDTFSLTCSGAGNLVLTNSIENRRTAINNVTSGEIITCDNTVSKLTTNKPSHDILNDFNYNFFRLANTYSNRTNEISSNIACSINFTYTPRRKVVF